MLTATWHGMAGMGKEAWRNKTDDAAPEPELTKTTQSCRGYPGSSRRRDVIQIANQCRSRSVDMGGG